MLLPRAQEVQRERTEERRNLIEEGIKIARRIDALRKTLGEEEAKLQAFREGSMKQVLSDIKVLQDERSSLKQEILELKQQKELLQAEITNTL